MSNIYIQEPSTNGKVCLTTTFGDIDIELWSREAPKACRNFVQLCIEGYYNGTIVHRIVRGFIAQCGDPTGTGRGGESIYGKPFPNEIHSRLQFNRRGLVATANSGNNDNNSQLFFTLGAAPELNRKHTIFGKVVGNTLYNMVSLDDMETDSDDRPKYPPKILKAEVLNNPFDDIRPRQSIKQENLDDKRKQSQSRATKNFSLLSFGAEAEEDEDDNAKSVELLRKKPKSSHDLLDDRHLSSATEPLAAQQQQQQHNSGDDDDDKVHPQKRTQEDVEELRENVRKKLRKEEKAKEKPREEVVDESLKTSRDKLQELKMESRRLKKELMSKRKNKTNEEELELHNLDKTTATNRVVEEHMLETQKYKEQRDKMKRQKTDRELATLKLLSMFQTKLDTAKNLSEYGGEEEKQSADKDEVEDDEEDFSWMSHELRFETKDKKVLDANVTDADRYEIFDPRNPMNKRRRETSKKSKKS